MKGRPAQPTMLSPTQTSAPPRQLIGLALPPARPANCYSLNFSIFLLPLAEEMTQSEPESGAPRRTLTPLPLRRRSLASCGWLGVILAVIRALRILMHHHREATARARIYRPLFRHVYAQQNSLLPSCPHRPRCLTTNTFPTSSARQSQSVGNSPPPVAAPAPPPLRPSTSLVPSI